MKTLTQAIAENQKPNETMTQCLHRMRDKDETMTHEAFDLAHTKPTPPAQTPPAQTPPATQPATQAAPPPPTETKTRKTASKAK